MCPWYFPLGFQLFLERFWAVLEIHFAARNFFWNWSPAGLFWRTSLFLKPSLRVAAFRAEPSPLSETIVASPSHLERWRIVPRGGELSREAANCPEGWRIVPSRAIWRGGELSRGVANCAEPLDSPPPNSPRLNSPPPNPPRINTPRFATSQSATSLFATPQFATPQFATSQYATFWSATARTKSSRTKSSRTKSSRTKSPRDAGGGHGVLDGSGRTELAPPGTVSGPALS